MIAEDVREGAVAPEAAPVVQEGSGFIYPRVIPPSLDVPCDVNVLHPCLAKKPQPAVWMVRYVDCDCDIDVDEGESQVVAYCQGCLNLHMSNERFRCGGCGTVYVPASAVVDDIVRIPRH